LSAVPAESVTRSGVVSVMLVALAATAAALLVTVSVKVAGMLPVL